MSCAKGVPPREDGTDGAISSIAFATRPEPLLDERSAPAIPPHMQGMRSRTADEVVQMMGRTPLFMTTMDDMVDDEENIELEAIRALQYEGTPVENARNLKEQGNEMVKEKKWSDAKEYYTQALAVLSKRIGSQEESVKGDEKASNTQVKEEQHQEQQIERDLEEACYVNRALCNLELKNYRSVTLDCASALRLHGKNVKAYYRCAQALLALNKIEEARDACAHGIALDPSNIALRNLSTRISDKGTILRAAEEKKLKEVRAVQRSKMVLAAAMRARNIRTRKTAQPPDLEDASIHLSPDPLLPNSTLILPVLLLYPLHAQTDFIKAFPETDTVSQHLEYILPLPWDEHQEYQSSNVELYMETCKGGLIQVGKRMTLLEILAGREVEVVDELVKINIVPKNRAGSWIEDLRSRKGK
ncbi:MAG: hypothetical protein Q9163_003602 [Psora crenata]